MVGWFFDSKLFKDDNLLLRFWTQQSSARMNSVSQGLLCVDRYALQGAQSGQFTRNLYFAVHSFEYSGS